MTEEEKALEKIRRIVREAESSLALLGTSFGDLDHALRHASKSLHRIIRIAKEGEDAKQ